MQRGDFCRLAFLALLALASGCSLDRLLPEDDMVDKNGLLPAERELLKETMYFEKLEDGKIRCRICFKNCVVPPGGTGFCHNRINKAQSLYNIVYGRPSAVQFDPVEKEPLHHFLPGTSILCIGTAGCNFRCKFCHNWQLSQQSIDEIGYYQELEPADVVQKALERWKTPSISFTYNEPTVFYEYVYDIARLARENELKVVIHSNASMNPDPLKQLIPYVDAFTIDLKAFRQDFYRDVSQGELEHVLGTLEKIKAEGVWLELVNLVIPDLNDDLEDIKKMSHWICEHLGPETPLHFSRFFPAYRLTDLAPTPVETLEQAHATALQEGLLFVSLGNVPGHKYNSTFCPDCGEIVIERVHFTVHSVKMEDGRCASCGAAMPGVWE